MSRACTVCSHTDAPAIDQQLDQGIPYRQLAGTCGVSKSALVRHTQHGASQVDHESGRATGPASAASCSCPCSRIPWADLARDLAQYNGAVQQAPHAYRDVEHVRFLFALVAKMLAGASAQQH